MHLIINLKLRDYLGDLVVLEDNITMNLRGIGCRSGLADWILCSDILL
jgi:hypothetical protein